MFSRRIMNSIPEYVFWTRIWKQVSRAQKRRKNPRDPVTLLEKMNLRGEGQGLDQVLHDARRTEKWTEGNIFKNV